MEGEHMARKLYYNLGDKSASLPPEAPVDAVRAEFARRLQRAMIDKNWSQSELARRAARFTSDKEFPRDNVSKYIRGKVLPGPNHLEALSRALDIRPTDLLPTRGVPRAGMDNPPLDIRSTGDGNVWLRVNLSVSMATAVKVMQIIEAETGAITPKARR